LLFSALFGRLPKRRLEHSRLAHTLSGAREAGELHFRVFAREDHAWRAGPEGGVDGSPNIVRRNLPLAGPGRNAHVNARVDRDRAIDVGDDTFGFAGYVVGGEASCGKLRVGASS